MRLELGSGYHPSPGFTHLDANPNAPHVEIVGNVEQVDLPDGVCSEIRAVDVLEHLPYRRTGRVLREWARLLVPGGRLYVQVPDAAEVMRWWVEQPERLLDRLPGDVPVDPLTGAAWRLLGGQDDDVCVKSGDDWRLNAHYSLFSSATLTGALTAAGFVVESIETNGHPNLCCWAVK